MFLTLQRSFSVASVLFLFFGATAYGGLVTSHTDGDAVGAVPDGVISPNEYGPGNSYSYTGGGGGFGGTLGSGTVYFQSDATNLYFGFQPGNNVQDNVVVHLDTRAGGFTDADMNDTADPGRNLLSNLTRDVDDPFPTGFVPDYGLVVGGFGMVLFELNAGNTPGHLIFKQFDGTFTGNNPALAREIAIPKANLGNPAGAINFLASYGSDTNFMSNESIPAEVFNAGGNPGFDNGGSPVLRENYDQFNMIPEPSSLTLLAIGALGFLLRRRQ
jgi:hypothetical protein